MPGLPYPAFRMVNAEAGGGPSLDGSPYTLRNSITKKMPTSRRGRDRFRSALQGLRLFSTVPKRRGHRRQARAARSFTNLPKAFVGFDAEP
jgi:hypothetical protein